MLITIYYPFSDERTLFPSRSTLIQSRFSRFNEPNRFARNLGRLIDRPKGGFLGWIGENTVCAIHRSIEIPFHEWSEGKGLRLAPTTAFKRFFFDGLRGYFSIGVSLSGSSADVIVDRGQLVALLSILSKVPVRSAHRIRQIRKLEDFSQLALDLYASGSVRKLTDLSSQDYERNIHFAKPIIVVSFVNTGGASPSVFDRQLNLDLRSPVQLSALGQETFAGFIQWPERTFVFVISSRSRMDAANSRFLRAGVARLYLEAYSLERMITLLQSPLFEECDTEGRNLIGASVNESLGRLHGAEKPDIADTKASYDALVATFARIFRPGHVADLENILNRLHARPNLRRALARSLIVDTATSMIAIKKVEVIMGDQVGGDKIGGDKVLGNKTTQTGGLNVAGNATAGSDMVAGDKTTNINSQQQISTALAPVAAAIANAPTEKAAEANQKLKELEAEAAKGKDANDSILAKLVEGLVGLVPSAVTAIVGAFGTPILGGIAGPVTKYVLDKIQGK
jgi:hypothetical protein